MEVPGGWGRTSVLDELAAGIETADDTPVTIIIRTSGREVADGTALQAQILHDLLSGAKEGHRAVVELLGTDSAADRAQFGLGVAGLTPVAVAAGFPAALGIFLAGIAARAVGKIWDHSPAGQAGAVATAARSVAAMSVKTPVVVLVDDAESLDVHLAMVALENLVSRGDGQILIVVAASPRSELARRLAKRDLPPALVPAVGRADADPDMRYTSRARLARELCPQLPGPVITRIGQRTRTFAHVFTVVDACAPDGPAGDADTLLPAVDRVDRHGTGSGRAVARSGYRGLGRRPGRSAAGSRRAGDHQRRAAGR